MADDLKKVVKALAENNQSQEETTEAINKLNATMAGHFTFLKRQIKAQEEAQREAAKQQRVAQSDPKTNMSKGSKGGGNFNFGPMVGIGGLLLPLTAGITAFAAAMAGLRGWEVGAISKLTDTFKNSIPLSVSNGMIRLRNTVLGKFGLTAEGLLIRGEGRSGFFKAPPITEQIRMKMNAFRLRVLKVFGIGADGKLLTLVDEDGLFKKNVIGRVAIQVRSLFSPIVKAGATLGEFFTSKLWTNVTGLFSGAGRFLKVVGGILKPLGIIYSAWTGITEFIKTDKEGFIAKFGAGVGAFFGDFIGAPFDLIKAGILWIAKKLFPGITSEDGSYDDSTIAGRIASLVEQFSFQNLIKNLVEMPFDFVQNVVDWVKGLFTDPKTALSGLWDGLLKTIQIGGKAVTKFLDILWMPINLFIDWVSKKLGWRDEEAPTFSVIGKVKEWAGSALSWIGETFLKWTNPAGLESITDKVTGWAQDFFSWLAGFMPDISTIVDKIEAKITSILPDWLKDALGLAGPDATPEDIAKAAEEKATNSLRDKLLKYDTNNDGLLSLEEYKAAKFIGKIGQQEEQRKQLVRDIFAQAESQGIKGDMLEDLFSQTGSISLGGNITIVDNSSTTNSSPPAAPYQPGPVTKPLNSQDQSFLSKKFYKQIEFQGGYMQLGI